MAAIRQRLSWKQCAEIEPRLLVLEAEIKAEDSTGDPHYCANQVWYRKYKDRMCALVGWDAKNPALDNDAAYDVVYRHLYDLLPDCRDCRCFRWPG